VGTGKAEDTGEDVRPVPARRAGERANGFRFPKAAVLLAEAVRIRILSQDLPPGRRLPSEADLIEQSGFSRATVREALRLLESEGLIEIKRGPGGGVTVREPDHLQAIRALALSLSRMSAPLRDLFEIRLLLEPQAAALAARKATPDQRRELVELANCPPAAEGSAGFGATIQAHTDFHVTVGDATGNDLFRVMVSVVDEIVRLHSRGENFGQRDLRETQLAHRRIANAIAAGDEDLAADAMRRHLRQFERRMGEQGRLDEPIVPRSHLGNDMANGLATHLVLPGG
jgi:GntR family transcriptional repressor for pyruvate dehydrogenase complex